MALKKKQMFFSSLPFIKFSGIRLFRLKSSSALGCVLGHQCAFLAVDFSSVEGGLSAEQGFDVGIERRIRI